jgi:hypothetical protein
MDMAEVAFRKVLGIRFRLKQQQYFLLEIERGNALLTAFPPPKFMNSV